jgi:flagellar hook-basal body complex protein FliE
MEGVRWEGSVQGVRPEAPGQTRKDKAATSFEEVLKASIQEVNDLQKEADEAIRELARGQTQDLHKTMILMEKAELSLKLMVQVRNKLLDAYQELMRMPV